MRTSRAARSCPYVQRRCFRVVGLAVIATAALALLSARASSAAELHGLVRAEGKHLTLDGARYVVKGVMPRVLDLTGKTAFYDDLGEGMEMLAPNRFWRDFDQAKPGIEATFDYLRCRLQVNTVRLLTANPATLRADVAYHGFQPWYLADGSINPVYRDRLVELLGMASRHGIRIQLVLFADAKNTEWECQDLKGEWAPCKPSSETEDSRTAAVRQAAARGAATVRFVRPGTDREKFFLTYLRSLVPALVGQPGLFAYELGNENLLYWEINGPNVRRNEWYQNQVGSFLRRMITEVRRLDPGHLIGSGEVGYYGAQIAWAPFAAELGRIEDIDNLNGGAPFTLESLVDFVGAHLYNYVSGPPQPTLPLVRNVAAQTSKPLVPGEFNYYENFKAADVRAYPKPNPQRRAYYEMAADFVDKDLMQGFILFDPLPVGIASPDAWKPVDVTWSNEVRKGVEVGGRKLLGLDLRSSIFAHGEAEPFHLEPFPEAKYFAELWPDAKATAAFCKQ